MSDREGRSHDRDRDRDREGDHRSRSRDRDQVGRPNHRTPMVVPIDPIDPIEPVSRIRNIHSQTGLYHQVTIVTNLNEFIMLSRSPRNVTQNCLMYAFTHGQSLEYHVDPSGNVLPIANNPKSPEDQVEYVKTIMEETLARVDLWDTVSIDNLVRKYFQREINSRDDTEFQPKPASGGYRHGHRNRTCKSKSKSKKRKHYRRSCKSKSKSMRY